MNTSDRLSLARKATFSGVRAYRMGNVKRMNECFAFALDQLKQAGESEHIDFALAASRGHVRDAGKLERQELSDQAERLGRERAS